MRTDMRELLTGMNELDAEDFEHFVYWWCNKPVTDEPRDNLDYTDKLWKYTYEKCDNLRFEPDALLFRVHTGGLPEPTMDDCADWQAIGYSSQLEHFDALHK